ncbi:transposase [Streptomyces mirabilis]|uniref:transposase n=1 Tax=Streptomyces mirabilis TaxID=68239 RepID=UPI0033C25661
MGRDAEPSAAVIDSQSVKADAVVGADSRGFDGGKLVNGRKRHVVVDTLGLLLGVMVTAADIGDRAAARVLLEQVADAHHRLALVWADGGYTGSLVKHCLAAFALVLAIVKRSDDMRGFVLLPKRWIVEDAVGWSTSRMWGEQVRAEARDECRVRLCLAGTWCASSLCRLAHHGPVRAHNPAPNRPMGAQNPVTVRIARGSGQGRSPASARAAAAAATGAAGRSAWLRPSATWAPLLRSRTCGTGCPRASIVRRRCRYRAPRSTSAGPPGMPRRRASSRAPVKAV